MEKTTINSILDRLEQSPMLYLSSGSKELFHSNFLYWLGVTYRDAFQQLMSRLCHISDPWPNGWVVRREHHHLDLCVTYERRKEKKGKGGNGAEECAFIIVENKVKSLPDRVQLWRYEQLFEGRKEVCTYAVLSMVKDFYGNKAINENTCWHLHHYDELARLIEECFTDDIIHKEHRTYIHDYCRYIRSLSELVDEWSVKGNDVFLQPNDRLRDLRLNDLFEKIRYAQIAGMIAQRLRQDMPVNADGEECVVLGMSNADVILRRGRKDAEEILTLYGCPEAKLYLQVFIGIGMGHTIGFVEAKVKVSDDCCLVVQVQGDRYCHGIERMGIVDKRELLTDNQRQFLDFKIGGLNGHAAGADSKECSYSRGYLYRMQKVNSSHTVDDIVASLVEDIKECIHSYRINIPNE